ncbi:MAG TPA: dihydrodipicolinate synthase family protein [Verrucomicrobiota bacterium]|nr:dihydrodipicolinate synthase family protein [Verrucomicrobiota bacterium]HQL79673.1 dihydrodipicolinate synthase family protein [Verrucomicrobiota bacterium]
MRPKQQPLEGIVPPMITPLAGRDQLDEPGLERLVEHVIAGGVQGLFILGTSGEAPALSYRLRRALITRVCRQAAGRLPVLVGITDTSLVEAVALAQHAAESGAQALVTSAPYYFPPGQPELVDYVQRLVPELRLPLYLYNLPQMTKVQFAPESLRRLAQLEGIIGVKDSSGDLSYFRQLVEVARERPDWRLFIGPEHLLADALRLGGHGGVNGGALIEPPLFVGLLKAVKSGDAARAAELQQRLLALGRVYAIGRHASAVIKGLKCSLSLLGICSDVMAEPLTCFAPPERARVRAVLAELGLLPPNEPAAGDRQLEPPDRERDG